MSAGLVEVEAVSPVERWAQVAALRRRNPRDRFLHLVQYGRLLPEQAETWARKNGRRPFAEEPDPARFEPMEEADWTLAMTTAWIVARTPDAVRRAWRDWLAEVWRWRAIDVSVSRPKFSGGFRRCIGHVLDQPEIATALMVVERATLSGATLAMPADEVERELRRALRLGRLVARHGREAEQIPAHRWSTLSPFTSSARRRAPHDGIYDDEGTLQFERVNVERESVMELWPTLAVQQTSPRLGRWSARDLWWPEFERREALGLNAGHLATAQALHSWFSEEIEAGRRSLPPGKAPPSVATLEGSIQTHRSAKKRCTA